MSLPVLDTPKFELVMPSTQEKLMFRPFLVREQKMMLQAVEMGNVDQLNNAVEDILKSCTFEKFDFENAPLYDVEWVLLNIRAKSAGELVEMIYKCNGEYSGEKGLELCENKIHVNVPLTAAMVVRPEGHDYKIMVTDKIGMTLRDLPYGLYKTAVKKKITPEASMEMIKACVVNVFDEEQVHGRKDFTNEELTKFIESFDSKKFEKIEKFLDTMPYLEIRLPLKCSKCGNKDEIVLRGLDDFLA